MTYQVWSLVHHFPPRWIKSCQAPFRIQKGFSAPFPVFAWICPVCCFRHTCVHSRSYVFVELTSASTSLSPRSLAWASALGRFFPCGLGMLWLPTLLTPTTTRLLYPSSTQDGSLSSVGTVCASLQCSWGTARVCLPVPLHACWARSIMSPAGCVSPFTPPRIHPTSFIQPSFSKHLLLTQAAAPTNGPAPSPSLPVRWISSTYGSRHYGGGKWEAFVKVLQNENLDIFCSVPTLIACFTIISLTMSSLSCIPF